MNESECAFYFAIKHDQSPGDNIGYKKFPLGKNEVGKSVLKAAQNYYVGNTGISKVFDSDLLVIV